MMLAVVVGRKRSRGGDDPRSPIKSPNSSGRQQHWSARAIAVVWWLLAMQGQSTHAFHPSSPKPSFRLPWMLTSTTTTTATSTTTTTTTTASSSPPMLHPLPQRRDEYAQPSSWFKNAENLLSLRFPRRTPATSEPSAATMKQQPNMMVYSAIGALFSLGVVYALAMTGEEMVATTTTTSADTGGDVLFLWTRHFQTAAENIVDAAVPLTATDAFSVAVGEGFAGIVGAAASLALRAALRQLERAQWFSTTTTTTNVNTALADGDYFVTRAAALPLLTATGLSPMMASLGSVVLASVPYELVKIGSRRRQEMRDEEKVLDELLKEQQQKESSVAYKAMRLLQPSTDGTMAAAVDPATLRPIRPDQDKVDYVEIFSDVTKWLAYDVLSNDYTSTLYWNGQSLFPGAESAVLGALAALSARVYADVLYVYFGFGGEARRTQVLTRPRSEWSALYLSECIASATLFGVYEAAQIPARGIVSALVSGGMGACLGSQDYNMCVETFLVNNPPENSANGDQFHALIASIVDLWNLLGLGF